MLYIFPLHLMLSKKTEANGNILSIEKCSVNRYTYTRSLDFLKRPLLYNQLIKALLEDIRYKTSQNRKPNFRKINKEGRGELEQFHLKSDIDD